MASNDQWPPVALASAGKNSTKINGNKRNVKESQQEILNKLNEMFGSVVEPAVVLSVVQNCNWELQPSIDGLITLSETVENPPIWNESRSKSYNTASPLRVNSEESRRVSSVKTMKTDCVPYTVENSPILQTTVDPILPQKWENHKRDGTKNRMGSFCDNIAKLKSYGENVRSPEKEKPANVNALETNPFFDDSRPYGAMRNARCSPTVPSVESYGNFPDDASFFNTEAAKSLAKEKTNESRADNSCSDTEKMDSADLYESQVPEKTKDSTSKSQNVASFDSKTNIRKTESESLCGLKVQYRLSGMESSSDDDADVVIEDESSDYAINLTPSVLTSVSQFLSPSTQTASKRTKPEIQMISTPSPPATPQRSNHDITRARIEETIKRGYKILIIIRGLPGSGKTTLAKNLLATTIGDGPFTHIFSTDDFFVNLGRGTYQYVPSKISDAHATNHMRVAAAMRNGRSPVIVDNTNIEAWEMRPYAALAIKNGYIVEILEPNTPWARNPKELAQKNVHNVAKAKICERALRYETIANGQTLLDMYGLKYSCENKPPRMRLEPPICPAEKKRKQRVPSIDKMRLNWNNYQKNNYVLSSHDIESMQNIDESHNSQSVIAECPIIEDDSIISSVVSRPEMSSNYADKVFNDYLEELQDSDDESFETVEGSGSENLSDAGKSVDVEGSSYAQCSSDLPKKMTDETEETSGKKDFSPNSSQQILGAIGSERKSGLSVSANNYKAEKKMKKVKSNDNVLSQCWDFTLILGRHKLHSRHGPYVSPFAIPPVKNTKKANNSVATVGKNLSGGDDKSALEKKIVTLESQIIVEAKSELAGREIGARRTEISEEQSQSEKSLDVDANKEMEKEEEEDIVADHVKEKTLNIQPDSVTCCPDNLHQNSKVDIVEHLSPADIAASNKSEKNEEEGASSTTSIGSIFNLIKTSFLGTEEPSSNVPENVERLEYPDNAVSSVDKEKEDGGMENTKNPENTKPFEKTEAEVAEEKKECSKNEDDEVLISFDIVDLPAIGNLVEQDGENVECGILDENSGPDKILDVENRSISFPSEDESTTPNIAPKQTDFSLLTDNINCISWKESPFPVDGTDNLPLPVIENETTVSKKDAQTMTTLYDFNVAYVGGTLEPEYRELWGVSRSINDGTKSINEMENRTRKQMFDKSSMTGETDILANAANLTTGKEKDSTNRLDDLIEMFPHYPSEYLKTLYEQQCNCNFDWVVDVLLLADVPNLTIENYETKRPNSAMKSNETVLDAAKLWKLENEKLEQRSHSSSPRNRRNKAKDFRSFSLECVEDYNLTSGDDALLENYELNAVQADEADNKILNLFYSKAVSESNSPTVQGDVASSSSTPVEPSRETNDDDGEEIVELNCGHEFINQLEMTCGNPDFSLPEEFKPVIRMKKSMMEELYGLWIQSMDDQMKALHAQLDERMAKDEAMARAVDREEAVKTREPVVPNLAEIMNMEMALARYQNELKEKVSRETPDDMASRLTRQMLYELLPDIDQETLSNILKAHGGNFQETCEIIEASIGRTISKSDTLKKQQSLLERVSEERRNLDIQQDSEYMKTPLIVVNPDIYTNEKTEKTSYKEAIERGDNARLEAQKQFSLRIENYNKAAEAYRKGNPEVAAYYSQMVDLHTQNIEAAHANAAAEFLSAQTYARGREDTLDLHNLFVREALQALDDFLDFQLKKLNKSNKRNSTLFIITGHGARSNNGVSRIKPAVSKKLISKNIRFTEANSGCLKVTLSRRNGIVD